eukprot:gene19936-56953_t
MEQSGKQRLSQSGNSDLPPRSLSDPHNMPPRQLSEHD